MRINELNSNALIFIKESDQNPRHLSSINRTLIFILSITYAYVLSRIPSESFQDFGNYLIYAEFPLVNLFAKMSDGLLPFLANEPVWLLANALLSIIFQPEEIVRLIIFISAFSVTYITISAHPKLVIWLLFFLIMPNIVKNHLIHLRQGFAISIFLAGWFSLRRGLGFFLIALTPFIHASFFFVVLFLLLTKIMRQIRFGVDVRTLVFVLLGFGTAFFISTLSSFFGARQAEEYEFTSAAVSGFGFIFWFLIAALMLSQGPKFSRDHAFEIGCLVFYLCTYFFIEVTARIFESTILLVLLAGLAMKGRRLFAFQSLVLFFWLFSWLARVGQPMMGFGVD